MKEEGKLTNSDGTPGARLVYIDPPFATRKEFHGNQDQKAYQDKIYGARFVEFLRKRLIFLRELLSDDGAIYVHLDWKKVRYIKVILDEVFGENNFRNEIVWHSRLGFPREPGLRNSAGPGAVCRRASRQLFRGHVALPCAGVRLVWRQAIHESFEQT
jgi:hypothetical protein